MLDNQRRRRVALAVIIIVAAMGGISACSGGTEPSVHVRVEAVSATSLVGVVGQEVSPVPTVRVTDEGGAPVAGKIVHFTLKDPGASVGVLAAETNVAGLADAGSWTLGTRAGLQTLAARAGAASTLFRATVESGPASEIWLMEGDGQVGKPGELLPGRVRAWVNDGDGLWNPVVGAPVTFTVISGGGSVEPVASVTDSAGYVEAAWTLGSSAGLQLVQVQSGAAEAIFTAAAS